MNRNVNNVVSCQMAEGVNRVYVFGRFSRLVAIQVHMCDLVCGEFGTYWYGFVPPPMVVSVGDDRGDLLRLPLGPPFWGILWIFLEGDKGIEVEVSTDNVTEVM